MVESSSPGTKRDYMSAHRAWSDSGAAQIFGTVLEALRSMQGLSQRYLADHSSGTVSFSHLRALESGERWPTDKALVNLAAQLGAKGISPAFLVQARDHLEALVPTMQRPPSSPEDELSTAKAICSWLVDVAMPAPFGVVHGQVFDQFPTVTWVASEQESRTFEVIRGWDRQSWRVVLGTPPPNVARGLPRPNAEPVELPTTPVTATAQRAVKNDNIDRLLSLARQLEHLDSHLDLVIAYAQALVDAQPLKNDARKLSGDVKPT